MLVLCAKNQELGSRAKSAATAELAMSTFWACCVPINLMKKRLPNKSPAMAPSVLVEQPARPTLGSLPVATAASERKTGSPKASRRKQRPEQCMRSS